MAVGATQRPPAGRERDAAAGRLRVTEIFLSIQGESASSGWPTVFVRLTGCPLRCRWCDTAYAFSGGARWSLDRIEAEVDRHGVCHVCITGGEPLAQPGCRLLAERLAARGHAVSIETGGALDIAGIDPRVRVVMDVKPPGSGESGRNRRENLDLLRAHDEVKFVIADRTDYEWARSFVREHELAARVGVLFSPVANELAPAALAEWILADRLPVRFQIQLHKTLWGDVPGR